MESLKYFFGRLNLPYFHIEKNVASSKSKKIKQDMSVGITRRCVIILADEEQYDDYSDFKSEIEERSNGVIELEDLEDIKSAIGGSESDRLKRFLEDRQVIVLICSEKLNQLLNQKREFRLKFDGNLVNLSGQVLHSCLEKDDIRNKVVMVSIDGYNELPNILQGIKTVVVGDTVNKALVNSVIFQIRGVKV